MPSCFSDSSNGSSSDDEKHKKWTTFGPLQLHRRSYVFALYGRRLARPINIPPPRVMMLKVVYVDQRLHAAQSKCWSKYAFSCFSHEKHIKRKKKSGKKRIFGLAPKCWKRVLFLENMFSNAKRLNFQFFKLFEPACFWNKTLAQCLGVIPKNKFFWLIYFYYFFHFSCKRHEKSIFWQVFKVGSTQTLVKIYNSCKL